MKREIALANSKMFIAFTTVVVGILPIILLLLIFRPVQAFQLASCTVPGDHTTIQAAVDDPGCEIINLGAGTFAETVVISRSVTIQGQGSEYSIVDGNDRWRPFTIEASADVTLNGITIQNGRDNYASSIRNAGSLILSSSIIRKSSGGQDAAIVNHGTLLITATSITGSQFYEIAIVNRRVLTIANSIIDESIGVGVENVGEGVLHILNSEINVGVGVRMVDGEAIIKDTTISGGWRGIEANGKNSRTLISTSKIISVSIVAFKIMAYLL